MGWSGPRPSAGTVVRSGLAVALTLALAGLGAVSLAYGEATWAVLCAVAAVVVGHVAWWDLWLLGTRRSRPVELGSTPTGEAGLVLPYWRWSSYLLVSVTSVVLSGFTVLTAAAVTAGYLGTGSTWPQLLAASLSTVVTLGAAWWLVALLRGRVARGRVVLTRQGVYHRGWTSEAFMPWNAIVAVEALDFGQGPVVVAFGSPAGAGWARRTGPSRASVTAHGVSALEIPARWSAVDPALAYYAVRYYHCHPEARGELVSAQAVRRLHDGDVLQYRAPLPWVT